MARPVLLVHFCLGVFLLLSLPRVGTAAGTAVVRGASSLHVRSGPGREYPALGTLTEGSTVGVETTEGSWVRIRTPNGETGYVHKAFLVPVHAAEPAPTAEETGVEERGAGGSEAAAEPVPPADSAARESASEVSVPPNDALAGQQRLERLVESLQADVKQLLEANRQRGNPVNDSEPMPTPLRGGSTADAAESGSLLGLSIIGLVAGFILGAIYGRRQERGRRTRVRF